MERTRLLVVGVTVTILTLATPAAAQSSTLAGVASRLFFAFIESIAAKLGEEGTEWALNMMRGVPQQSPPRPEQPYKQPYPNKSSPFPWSGPEESEDPPWDLRIPPGKTLKTQLSLIQDSCEMGGIRSLNLNLRIIQTGPVGAVTIVDANDLNGPALHGRTWAATGDTSAENIEYYPNGCAQKFALRTGFGGTQLGLTLECPTPYRNIPRVICQFVWRGR